MELNLTVGGNGDVVDRIAAVYGVDVCKYISFLFFVHVQYPDRSANGFISHFLPIR